MTLHERKEKYGQNDRHSNIMIDRMIDSQINTQTARQAGGQTK